MDNDHRRTHGEEALDPALARAWVARFERQQRRYGPPLGELSPLLVCLLEPVILDGYGRLLDLGCGAGSVGRRLLGSFPGTRVTGVDHDPLLLALARAAGGPDVIDADLGQDGWPGAAAISPGSLDAAVAWSVVHMLAPRALRRLYAELAVSIRPGGCLVIAERIPELGTTIGSRLAAIRETWSARTTRDNDDTWDSWWADAAHEPSFHGLIAERRRRFLAPSSDPPPLSLARHLALLRSSGFADAGLVWSRGDDRLLVGYRPDRPQG